MAMIGKPIVAINEKGEIVSGYDNVQEAARINHSHPNNIYLALKKRTLHKKHLWMWESEYRNYWFERRTSELEYSFQELRSRAVKKGRENMSEERKSQWKRAVSQSRKRSIKDNPGRMPRRNACLLCVTTGEVFDSMISFARKYDVLPSAVSHAARTGHRVNKMVVTKISEEEYGKRRSKESACRNCSGQAGM